VGYVELQSSWILLRNELRLAVSRIFEKNLVRLNTKIASQQVPQRRAASDELTTVFFEVKEASAQPLVRRQDVIGFGRCRLIKGHLPYVNLAGWKVSL
jgi:hypothetical protein